MQEQKGHLTEEMLKAWMTGTLSQEEERKLLVHAGNCNYCAELLADCLEQDQVQPPVYLQEEILEKSRSAEIRTVRAIHRTSKQMRLFLYSLKVGFALAASLTVLFILPQSGWTKLQKEYCFQEETKKSITEKLKDGSDRIGFWLDSLAEWSIFAEYEEEQND